MIKLIEERVRKIKLRFKVLLYIGMSILWSLANVGYSFGFLTWFALVPVLFMFRYETLRSASLYSVLFGSTFYLTNFWWMGMPFIRYFGGSPLSAVLGGILGIIVIVTMSIWHGLSYGCAVFLAKYISVKKTGLFYAVFPIIMTAADYFFPKLWHDQIGYSQYIFLGFCQTADIFGVPIITLIILYCNVTVLLIIEAYLLKKPLQIPVMSLLCVVAVIIVSIVYGSLRIDQLDTAAEDVPKAKIAVIQGNFDGLAKLDSSMRPKILQRYNELSVSVLDQSPDIIIWPETAISSKIDISLQYFDSFISFRGTPVLTGATAIEYGSGNDKSKQKRYNSLFLIDGSLKCTARYDKMRLIPLAETMPLSGLRRVMHLFGLVPFTEGTSNKVMTVGDIRLSPNICCEDLMPDLIRRSMSVKTSNGRQTSNLIVNTANDSWFGDTPAAKIHIHISAFRAIENRRPLVRSTCTGYSMICKPTGQIIHKTNLNETASFVSEIPLTDKNTVYDNGGWMFVYILLIISLSVSLVTFIMRSKRQLQLKKRLCEKRHQEKLFQSWMD